MQISKCLMVICVALVCLIPPSSHGADKASSSSQNLSTPDAIEKAREAMRQKMNELAGQTPTTREAPAAPSAPAPQTSPPPPPPAAPPSVPAVNPPTTAAAPADSDAIERARTAARKKLEETSQPQFATPPQAPNVPPAPTPPAGRLQMEPPPALPVITGPHADEQSIEKAREATRERLAELEKQQHQATANQGNKVNPPIAASTVPPSPTKPPKPAKPPKPPKPATTPSPTVAKPSDFPPLQGPPSPLSPEKQQRLADLLRRYRADQLTPEQYQTERAKIRAEP